MKFGKVDNPGEIDFTLPEDHPETEKVISKYDGGQLKVYVGCAKWNRKDLKGFYPPGTDDELEYYSRQFNSVELNATFYNTFKKEQVNEWYQKTLDNFRFFPKVNRYISHLKWLSDVERATDDFYNSVIHFKEKLGTVFLQLRDKFAPKFFDRVADYLEYWPDELPLAVEFRHTGWFNDPSVSDELYSLLEENDVANVLVDTAGRRDLMHMRMTNNEAFIRYVGANHSSDVSRLDDWVPRLKQWNDQGLEKIHFFVHQNVEKRSPALAAHFIKRVNAELGTDLKIPRIDNSSQGDLF